MLGYLKLAGVGLIVVLLLLSAWTARGWAEDASKLKAARAALQDEIKRRISVVLEKNQAQRELIYVRTQLSEARLAAAEAKRNAGVKIITRTIKANVADNPDCSIDEPVAGLLNRARAGDLSASTTTPDSP
jgi:transposase